MNPKYSPLFQSITLPSGIQLDNRVVMAPMTTWSGNDDNTVSDEEIAYYRRRSNGVGMVITGCAYVTATGRAFPGGFGIDHDDFIPRLRQLASTIKEQGAKAVLQIFHGGRKSSPTLVPNCEILSASNVPLELNGTIVGEVPRPLTESEIQSIIRDFGESTRRAIEAGFDGIEIHGANGYLIHQFFSPHSNRRKDQYGGSLEKRLTFPIDVINEVKRVVAQHAKQPFIVGYRFSPEEPETPGITMAETLALIDVLTNKELDYIHVSQGEFSSPPRRGIEDSRSRLEIIQERVRKRVPVIGVGSIHTADDAIQALQTGVSMIGLGGELIIDPDWVEKIRQGRESDIDTKLKKNAQSRLVVPNPLWEEIVFNKPGWVPIEN